jgi:hypothetical protein
MGSAAVNVTFLSCFAEPLLKIGNYGFRCTETLLTWGGD